MNQDFAETLVTADTYIPVRTSPDGRWILYYSIPNVNPDSPDSGSSTPLRLMRIPITGGPPELVLIAPLFGPPSCARSPSILCAFAEQTSDRKEIVFTAFDPVRGKGRGLARFTSDPKVDYSEWGLSPDGMRIGFTKHGGNQVYVLPLDGSSVRYLTVPGWSGFRTFDWSFDSNGFFIDSVSGLGSTLLLADLSGKPHSLLQQKSSRGTWGVPSPDGRHLAVLGGEFSSNMWMIENF